MNDKNFSKQLFSNAPTPKKVEEEELPLAEEEIDLGPCASSPRHKWVTALTLKHANKSWESFQYRHLDVRSTFEPTQFEVVFVGDSEKWKVVVTGRRLEQIYNLMIQGRLEWLKATDRDFDAGDKPIVLSVVATSVKDEEPETE